MEHVGRIQGEFREHSGSIQVPFRFLRFMKVFKGTLKVQGRFRKFPESFVIFLNLSTEQLTRTSQCLLDDKLARYCLPVNQNRDL